MMQPKFVWAIVAAALLLQGCLGAAVVGAGAGVAAYVDRRSAGAQIEDEAIELRATNRLSERFGGRAHVSVTSFNRSVLLTGETPDAKARDEFDKIVRDVPNVRSVTNEVQVAGITSLSARASDSGITARVKARFVDANRFVALHVKVVTEAGVVFLMGIVTEAEGNVAAELARTTSGVRKVVKVFDYCKSTDAVCRQSEPAKN